MNIMMHATAKFRLANKRKSSTGSGWRPSAPPVPRAGRLHYRPLTRPFRQAFMATATAYADALEFLFPRVTTIKFGLDTTRTLLAAVGALHMAGPQGLGLVRELGITAISVSHDRQRHESSALFQASTDNMPALRFEARRVDWSDRKSVV